MAIHLVQHNTNFTVNAASNYFLTVIIGNGQVGSTSFKNINGDFFSPDVKNTVIGSGAALKGNSLNVVSVVMEVNPTNTNIVLSYYISDVVITDFTTVAPTDTLPFASQINDTVTLITKLNFN
jgi:hypothetical protein